MRTYLGILLLLSVAMLAACNGDDLDVTETDPDQTFRTDTSAAETEDGTLSNDLLYDLIDAGVRPSRLEGRPQIIDRLPAPLDVTTEPRENRHVPNQIDTLRTYHYEGLELRTYEVSGDPETIITGITITSEDYEAPDGISVGMSRDQVEAEVMAPDEEEEDRWTYHFQTEATNSFMIFFQDDQVERLEWSFYYD